MTSIRDLHNQAMEFAELALLAQVRGEHEESARLFRQALERELAAIEILDSSDQIEPSYSVLHRSAATLALDCNDSRKAEQLVAHALSKSPPSEIADELRDILEQVHFKRHLELRGITLEAEEMQMSLSGRGVGFGIVHFEEFLSRVNNTSKLIYRIVERRRNRPFREKGRIRKTLKDDYEVFVSVPRAGFSVTLKLGRPSSQMAIPGILDTAEIVHEFMDLIDLANNGKIDQLRERIPNPAYFRNFLALAKNIAPDGENVRQVGFTTESRGSERVVAITRPRSDFLLETTEDHDHAKQPVVVTGVLRFADATHGESGLIKVIDEKDGTVHTIKVPEGMMNDIVRPMWASVVTVKGTREGKQFIILEDIQEE